MVIKKEVRSQGVTQSTRLTVCLNLVCIFVNQFQERYFIDIFGQQGIMQDSGEQIV